MQLTEIEQAFKELKHDLAIRPIFHQREDRIEAHIFLAFIAYCLYVTLKHLARPTGISATTVHRTWGAFGLQPHRVESFKLSSDPLFSDKVRDIVGLYLDPPDRALVLCIDEKSQIQTHDRTQPMLPIRPGQAERRSHNYKRHGTTTLFAALDTATGAVIGSRLKRHRAREFRSFLDEVESAVPAVLDIHIVMDNASSHKARLIQD